MKHPVTESESLYQNLENMGVDEILAGINAEDQKVAVCIKPELAQISEVVKMVTRKLAAGGRLFYIGSGTSGRLGVVDASECPPTFGVDFNMVNGIIAGGDGAIRKAVEHAEDDTEQGFKDLQQHQITIKDVVIGITASGKTPYVVGALKKCSDAGIETAAVTCNKNSEAGKAAKIAIEVEVGPEFVTGSTRMKAGTAQKMLLNMITTATMIKLGKVKGNRMVDMQLTNAKLIDRGTKMIMTETGLHYEAAHALLLHFGSARKAIDAALKG